MTTIGASLAGAAIFAVAAIWFSLQGWLARKSSNSTLFVETMKMVSTGVVAIGICLVAASVAVTAEIGTGWISLIALFAVPLTFVIIWRSVDVAARSFDGDRTGGVASARRVIGIDHQQNLRAA